MTAAARLAAFIRQKKFDPNITEAEAWLLAAFQRCIAECIPFEDAAELHGRWRDQIRDAEFADAMAALGIRPAPRQKTAEARNLRRRLLLYLERHCETDKRTPPAGERGVDVAA
jgi:hypothetical protein